MFYKYALPDIICLLFTSSTAAFAPRFGLTRPMKGAVTTLEMATGGSLNVKAVGIGSAAPPTILTNNDLESVVETSDEWIATRTGISQRRVLIQNEDSTNQRLSALSSTAAAEALAMSGLLPTDIDLIVMCTSSPDDLFGDATTVQAALGCTNAVAFDLTAACSGFLFGSVTAGQFLSNGGNNMKNALVIGGDALSRWVDWDDRNSCILFGDGAGAMVLSKCDGSDDGSQAGLLGFSMHSNGESHGDLICG